MTKVSSNAGKHPYLRPENDHLFDHLRIEKEGISLSKVKPVFVDSVQTDYSDQKKRKLFYQDVVIFKGEEYRIDYDTREYCWIMEKLDDPKKRLNLKKTASSVVFKRKNN